MSKIAATAKWNQSTPKYHRYHGTAVSVRTNVPIRNELVVQLIRSVGMRKGKTLLQANGRPRTTSAFAQVWTLPQCAQVNFCAFIFVVGQRFSSTVRPVSVSFDVDGQRTSKLFSPAPSFGLGRRGGSKRNRDAIIFRGDKRSAPCRCRKATSPSLLDLRWLGE